MLKQLCKQNLTPQAKEIGVRCIQCNRLITDDPYYIARFLECDVAEVVCVDCGLKE